MQQIFIPVDLQEFESLQRKWMREEIKKAIESTPAMSDQFSDLPEFLTRRQAAKMLSVSLGTLDNWTREGRLTKCRAGKVVRFKKSEILASFQTLKDSLYSRSL